MRAASAFLVSGMVLMSGNAGAASCLETVVQSGSMSVTSAFGWRYGANPNAPTKWQFHYGTDFSKKILATPMVVAPIAGTYFSYPGTAGCGNMVVITQSDGFAVKFCHLKAFAPDPATNNPRPNKSQIAVGATLGVPSNTGILPAPEHIHLEVVTKGTASSNADAMRVPPSFCGDVTVAYQNSDPAKRPPQNLVRPAGIATSDVYGTDGTNFDAAFYNQYMALNSGTGIVASTAVSAPNPAANVTTAKLTQSATNASAQPIVPAPVNAEEMSFEDMVLAEGKKRFGSEEWLQDLNTKGENALIYDAVVMASYQAYMRYQNQELREHIMQLEVSRTAILTEIAYRKKLKDVQDRALRSISTGASNGSSATPASTTPGTSN